MTQRISATIATSLLAATVVLSTAMLPTKADPGGVVLVPPQPFNMGIGKPDPKPAPLKERGAFLKELNSLKQEQEKLEAALSDYSRRSRKIWLRLRDLDRIFGSDNELVPGFSELLPGYKEMERDMKDTDKVIAQLVNRINKVKSDIKNFERALR